MEYVYAAMLLHKAGKKIDEHALTKVLEAASVHVDPARVKALVAALEGVDIEKAIESGRLSAAPVTSAVPSGEERKAEKKEEKKEKEIEKKSEEEAAAGLGSLFG